MAALGAPPDAGRGLDSRLAALRGRLAASRALEDLQPGLAAGAALALALGLLRFLDLYAIGPFAAAGAGACVALAFPAAGLLLRRTSTRRVATLVDERLGLAERVATAHALGTGEAADTPLSGLVHEDARKSLDAVRPSALRGAFRPRVLGKPLAWAAGLALAAIPAFRAEPVRYEKEIARTPAEIAREKKEKEDVAKAARKALEEAKKAEDLADPKHVALKAVAAEMRRQAEAMLRTEPTKAEAMAMFQKMGELARERQELLAGMDPAALKEMKASGELSKMDPDLQKLLSKLLGTDLKDINDQLAALDKDLKGGEGAGEWSPEQIAALKEQIDALAEALKKNEAALEGRPGMAEGLKVLGDPALLKELSERLGALMKTLTEQGWKPCQSPQGLNDGSMGDMPAGEPIQLTDAQLQAMIEKLKELQELADLGQLGFCKNCGLSGGT
jgi:hypothetical protein